MNNKKIIWKILILIGCIPFFITIIFGMNAAINGFSGLNLYVKHYGIQAFMDSIILFSYIYYPLYIIGIVLIVLSIIKLKKSNRNQINK